MKMQCSIIHLSAISKGILVACIFDCLYGTSVSCAAVQSETLGRGDICDVSSSIYLGVRSVTYSGQLRIPSHISVLHVEQEVVGDDTTALESVLQCDTVREELLRKEREISISINRGYVFVRIKHLNCVHTHVCYCVCVCEHFLFYAYIYNI
jgi:hypothetical protein